MISGMTIMLGKSFVQPRSCEILNGFRCTSIFSQPVCHTLNFKYSQIAQAFSSSAQIIPFHGSSTSSVYDSANRKSKPLVKLWFQGALFEQLPCSKCLIRNCFTSQSADSQRSDLSLASLNRRNEGSSKRIRKARVAGGSEKSSHLNLSADEGFSTLSLEQNLVSPAPHCQREGAEPAYGEDSRIKQSVKSGSLRVKSGSSGVARKEDGSAQKRTAFEQWAVKKLREDGLSALAVIEDMRQTFAPGSEPLDPRILLSECESGDLDIRGSVKTSPQPVLITNDHRDERNSTKSIGQTFPERSSEQTTSEKQVEERNGSPAGVPVLKPLLVKRSTTLPENWNGPGGTVVLIDKPQGWTSFAVCGKLRHTMKIQKVGHAGTLDPMATGLLIVCLGKATKLADSYQAMTKVYSGVFRLGEDTPSLDADTQVSDTLPWEHIEDEDIATAKQAFIGDILQSPPMYSAIKVKGERLYAKARRGEEIDVPARPVTVHEFDINRSPSNRQDVHFRVTCSKGTYIRSLCSDLGRALGSYAHLTALRREKIGSYSVSDAWTVEDLVESYHQHFSEPSFRS
ncbi:hypothetical protein Mapa_006596 [Marchantia paleacea]|nr:hypothetical protein Mapa_006596 [Marchantia paleacea]